MKKLLLTILGVLMISLGVASIVEQQVKVTILSGEINIFSPVQNRIYQERMVPINLSMSSVVKYFKYADNGNRLKTLCRNCNEYGVARLKRKPFDDGFHEVRIYGLFETGNITNVVNFTVDTKEPKIRTTTPRRNKFTNGSDFSIKYQEANVKQIELIWNGSKILSGCESGNDKICSTSVNLASHEDEEIEYYFILTDIINNTKKSRPTKVMVDTVSPKIMDKENSTTQGEGKKNKYIYFDIEIEEDNFDEVGYLYEYNGEMKWKRLCSRLRGGRCEVRKSFRKGEQNITIVAKDEAGNSDSFDLGFVVV